MYTGSGERGDDLESMHHLLGRNCHCLKNASNVVFDFEMGLFASILGPRAELCEQGQVKNLLYAITNLGATNE